MKGEIPADRIPCVLIGHDFFHEVQVITQIFFAGTKFEIHKEVPKKGFAVAGVLSGNFCTGEVYNNGRLTASKSLEVTDIGIKRTMMLALFYALKEVTGKPTPWGALTGVRPSKQVRIWFEEKDTEDVIARRLKEIYKCREDKIQLAINVAIAEERLISKHKPGTGLYIGIPFCPSRCLYCSFVTAQKTTPEVHSQYLSALGKELTNILSFAKSFNTIYIGGGTPTALSEKDLAVLLEMAAPLVKNNVEYTVEVGRPDSINKEKLKILKNYGVTRIAINPQSLKDETLRRIGRAHTAEDFFKAFEVARNAGFANINTDIIAGLPGENPRDMICTMEGLRKLKPESITVHTLAIKRASHLNEHRQEHPPGDYLTVDKMLGIAQEYCEGFGLFPYYMYRQKNMAGLFENVGYSLPGYESLYNVAMMAETQTIIAAGAGGVTKIVEGTKVKSARIERKFNPKNVETYIQRIMPKSKRR